MNLFDAFKEAIKETIKETISKLNFNWKLIVFIVVMLLVIIINGILSFILTLPFGMIGFVMYFVYIGFSNYIIINVAEKTFDKYNYTK